MNTPKPVVLCILDGWGLRDDPQGNAPLLAKTPHVDRIMQSCPSATLTNVAIEFDSVSHDTGTATFRASLPSL